MPMTDERCVILASMRDIEWAVRVTRCWSKWDVSEGCQWEGKEREKKKKKKTRAVMCKLCCRKWKSTDLKVRIQHLTQNFQSRVQCKGF